MPVIILAVLGATAFAIIHRLLVHRERMAELESRRPNVMLQLPPGQVLEADDLTREIMEACRAKGVELDVEVESL